MPKTRPANPFPRTEAVVISIVQHAYLTGDPEFAKDLLEAENEAGCPLN